MLQLSFEFAGDQLPTPSPVVEDRPNDDLDRAYARASNWSKALAERLGRPVRLVITDNRSTMLSARPKGDRLEVRLHHMFLVAEDDILDAVSDYLAGSHASSGPLDAFIEAHRAKYVAPSRPQSALRTAGEHHELREIVDDLLVRYFGHAGDVKITWGKRVQPKRTQRSLQLGTYLPDEKLIRIHPVLDQAWVPRFFVEAVVFHELLHYDMPAVVQNGRRHYHTRAFKRRERTFEHYAAAQRWEKENLWRLLRGK
ncbi:MAG: hypothetical protein AAF500_00490 [Myxococcota bacterium]